MNLIRQLEAEQAKQFGKGKADVPFDSRGVVDGRHDLVLQVFDAAGNVTQSESRSVTVDNAGRSCTYGLGGRGGPRFKVRHQVLNVRGPGRPSVSV